MFVSSSLERIPQPAPIGKSMSFTQINNINGNSCSVEGTGRSLSQTTGSSSPTTSSSPSIAVENTNTTPSAHSPVPKSNATDAPSPIPVPKKRSTCHIKPLAETYIENDLEERTSEKSIKINNMVASVKIEEIHESNENGQRSNDHDEDGEEEEAIRAQVTTQITTTPTGASTPTIPSTPSSTYSRYDIYRWRERPFGPSYRRKERQRREEELMSEENNKTTNNHNGNNKMEGGKINEKDDRFHPFINRFTSPQTYYEEEYSYEPAQQISSMKTVLRTRSMINLDGDDSRVLVRKTLSDANLDQDKNSNFRFNHERNNKHNTISHNNRAEKHHYFGYLDLQSHHQEKPEHQDLFHQKQQHNEHHHNCNNMEDGAFRKRLRDLLVNNELVIQPRRNQPLDTPTNRRCFYHPVRINRELIDEELPDPDQVKLARDRFEKVLKIKGPEAPRGLQRTASVPAGQRITPEVRIPLSNTLPTKISSSSNEKWTDSGSLSSGVSSASEDVEDQLHEVSSEVLQKIRAYGTTVTYYGGKVIAQSHGPPSPLTSTIMEEIKFRLEVRDRLPFEEYQPSGEH